MTSIPATSSDATAVAQTHDEAWRAAYQGIIPGSWVFYGDPLSTTVNSRGEPADTGESRAITFDSVNAGGKSSFILNAVNLHLFTGIGRHASFEGLIDFVLLRLLPARRMLRMASST